MTADADRSAESDRFEDLPHPRETLALNGHRDAERQMLEAYAAGRLPHAWAIGGPEGIGKATLAWRFARFILAHSDPTSAAVQEAADLWVAPDHAATRQIAAGGFGDIALLRRELNEKTGRLYSEIRIDDVRRVAGLFRQSARAGGYRVSIIDSAEDLNTSSANALLKLIEEPPPLSLFLIVAHKPARLMPTLRSRCRLLLLGRLEPEAIARTIKAMGLGADEATASDLVEAAERAGGSVRAAVQWLGGERLGLHRDITTLLAGLPELDWRALHRLGDRIAAEPEDFARLIETVLDWLHGRVRAQAEASHPRRLARLAEVWEKIRRSARDAEIFNLDKRTIILSIFADLAQATRLP